MSRLRSRPALAVVELLLLATLCGCLAAGYASQAGARHAVVVV